MVYIHDYWTNTKKYDIHGDDYVFDLPSTVWEAGTGKWLSGPDSSTYQSVTGVPLTREEFGSARYINFINNYLSQEEIDGDEWKYQECLPKSWSDHPDLHPQFRISPGGGPDFSTVGVRPIRFNNLPENQFDIYGIIINRNTERLKPDAPGPNSGRNINHYNGGLTPTFVISDRHVMVCNHFMIETLTRTPYYGMRFLYFLNKDNEVFKKEFKFLNPLPGGNETEQHKENVDGFKRARVFDDCIILELKDGETGFSEIGIEPIKNMASLVSEENQDSSNPGFFTNYGDRELPCVTYDPQGRGYIQNIDLRLLTKETSFLNGNLSLSRFKVESRLTDGTADTPVRSPLSYTFYWVGDSGSPTWVYSESRGWIFMGGISGMSFRSGESIDELTQYMRTGERVDGDGNTITETHNAGPITPIEDWEPFELIESPNDLKLDVEIYDGKIHNPISTHTSVKAKITNESGEYESDSVMVQKPLSEMINDVYYTLNIDGFSVDPDQQRPIFGSFRAITNVELNPEITDEFVDQFPPRKIETVLEYQQPDSSDWILGEKVTDYVVGDGLANSNSEFRVDQISIPISALDGNVTDAEDFDENVLLRVRTKIITSNETLEYPPAPLGKVARAGVKATNLRFTYDENEVVAGNTFLLTLEWDAGPDVVYFPRLIPNESLYSSLGNTLQFNVINDTQVEVTIPSDVTGVNLIQVSAGYCYQPYLSVAGLGIVLNILEP